MLQNKFSKIPGKNAAENLQQCDQVIFEKIGQNVAQPIFCQN
jgi:hypothetical protein